MLPEPCRGGWQSGDCVYAQKAGSTGFKSDGKTPALDGFVLAEQWQDDGLEHEPPSLACSP